jgi:hypothetical protein
MSKLDSRYRELKKPLRAILDGPDCCGKTEIGKAIAQLTGAPYFKNKNEFGAFLSMDSEYFVNTVIYAEPFFLDYLEQAKASVILDRSFVSEWVYSRAFDRPTNEDWLRRIDEKYAVLGTKIIIPYRSSYTGRVDEMSSGKIDDKKMELLDSLYRQFSKWTRCKHIMLNVDDEDLTRELTDIIEFLESP